MFPWNPDEIPMIFKLLYHYCIPILSQLQYILIISRRSPHIFPLDPKFPMICPMIFPWFSQYFFRWFPHKFPNIFPMIFPMFGAILWCHISTRGPCQQVMLLGGGSVSLVAVPCLWHLGASPARGKPWIWMGTSICFGDYHVVMTNIAMVKPWPIEIDGLPIKNGDFPWLC